MSYYVYQHIRLDTNEVFYVGKGTKSLKGNCYKRAFTKGSRNNYWYNIINTTSYKVEILKEFNLEKEYLEYETELIIKYGYSWNNTGSLCNIVKDIDDVQFLARASSIKSNSKIVYKYLLNGSYVESFSSVAAAKKIYKCDIYNACSERGPTACGFQWRFFKVDNIGSYYVEESRINKSKSIYQYSLNNLFIKEWKGTKQPSEELHINRGAIRNCLSGLAKTAGKFIWSFDNTLKEDTTIKKYSIYKDGELIFSHNKLKNCANYLNFNQYSVSVYIRRNLPYKGYIFKCHGIKTQKEKIK